MWVREIGPTVSRQHDEHENIYKIPVKRICQQGQETEISVTNTNSRHNKQSYCFTGTYIKQERINFPFLI
jgi:hypothetical protein